jgi:hypothetical protein
MRHLLLYKLACMNKTTSKILLICLAFTASVAHADPATTTPHLYQDLQAHVRTLTHSIDTYSWTDGQSMGAASAADLSPTDPRGKSFVQSHLDAFENSQTDETHESMGVGLYLAVDPDATLYYKGNTDWVLLQVPFQVGTNYLDLRYKDNTGFSLNLSPATQAELQSVSCPAKIFSELTSIGSCRQFFVKVCDALNVDLIAYSYTTIQFPNIPNRAETSFVLTSGKNINWDRFRVFTKNIPSGTDPDSNDRNVIETSFVKMIAPSWLTEDQQDVPTFLASLRPWSQLAPMNDADWTAYITQHFFEAGSFPEDQYTAVNKESL